MPKQLTEEEIKNIWDTYQELGSINKTADELPHSKATVQKYVNKRQEQQEPEGDYTNGEADAETLDFSQIGVPDAEAETDVSLSEKAPGEFIEWYFTEDLGEIDVEGIGLFARRCNSKRAVPTEREMAKLLNEMPSKVGNNLQIDWIAEDYWARATEYIAAKTGSNPQDVTNKAISQNLAWMRVPKRGARNNNGQANQQHGGIGTMNQQDQQQSNAGGTGNPPQGTTREANGMGTPPAGNPQDGGQQGGPQIQMMQQMLEEMRRQNQQVMEAVQQNQAKNQQQGGGGLGEKIQEIAQIQETLETMNGDDEEMEQFVGALQQEIQQLRRQVQSGANEQHPDDPMAAVMSNMATRDDVDPEVLAEVAASAQAESSPEVQKKQIDMEIEKMKHERQSKMLDQVMDGLSEVAQNASELAEVASATTGQQAQQPRENTQTQHIEDTSSTDFSMGDVEQEFGDEIEGEGGDESEEQEAETPDESEEADTEEDD